MLDHVWVLADLCKHTNITISDLHVEDLVGIYFLGNSAVQDTTLILTVFTI